MVLSEKFSLKEAFWTLPSPDSNAPGHRNRFGFVTKRMSKLKHPFAK